jgi:hypothetical protein
VPRRLQVHGDGLRILVGDIEGVVEAARISLPAGDYGVNLERACDQVTAVELIGPPIIGEPVERQTVITVVHGGRLCLLDDSHDRNTDLYAYARSRLVSIANSDRQLFEELPSHTGNVCGIVIGPVEGDVGILRRSWGRGTVQVQLTLDFAT